MVVRSTVVLELGNMTGSSMMVLMMGSRKSSGAFARISSSRWRCSARSATRDATSCSDVIKPPPPIRTGRKVVILTSIYIVLDVCRYVPYGLQNDWSEFDKILWKCLPLCGCLTVLKTGMEFIYILFV